MTIINKEEVRRIARLARIEIMPDEEERFVRELSSILEFVQTLERAETGHGTDSSAVAVADIFRANSHAMREDGGKDDAREENSEDLLRAAPSTKDGRVRVRAVFDDNRTS